MSDPRGPRRTIKTAEFTPTGYVLTYEECDHVGSGNATMVHRAGDESRCFSCVGEAEDYHVERTPDGFIVPR